MIRVRNIEVRKGQKTILQNLSMDIIPGQITVVVGQNGAGKTTLLETLTGKNRYSKGQILWDRIPFNQLSMKQLSGRRAVLSQNISVAFPLKVHELIEMGTYASEDPLPQQKVEALINHSLQTVDMVSFYDRVFQTLSGGEQKRIMLAKSIVQLNCCHWADHHKYLFLDEPTSSLDIHQKFKLIETIKQLVKRRNIGIFAIVHDLNLASQFADQIIFLKHGEVLAKGTPNQVFTPAILKQALEVEAIVQTHPTLGCPHITPIPYSNSVLSI